MNDILYLHLLLASFMVQRTDVCKFLTILVGDRISFSSMEKLWETTNRNNKPREITVL